ncbi:hypothetical protein [uncultured Brevundimonas sp.]|uniref:hypothetical protein n=1 Tax=uncultured Brevundimonas sp. TaxID=213418 RepID=UPI0025EEE29D|nr:hypothetical protein [uncultured Brevundimonas sp.]
MACPGDPVCQAGLGAACLGDRDGPVCPGDQADPGEAGQVYPAYRAYQAFQGAVDRADPDGAGRGGQDDQAARGAALRVAPGVPDAAAGLRGPTVRFGPCGCRR